MIENKHAHVCEKNKCIVCLDWREEKEELAQWYLENYDPGNHELTDY